MAAQDARAAPHGGVGVERARDAVARSSWVEAFDAFVELDRSMLAPSDLEAFADAAWWICRFDESISARQSAYAGYAAEGEDRPAAGAALRLCIEHVLRGETSVAAGWLGRAQRHLREQPECVEQGFLALIEGLVARFGGDLDRAATLAERAVEIGQRAGDANLSAMAIHTQGIALIAAGRIAEGLPLLDEAMTAVLTGELSAYYTGAVFCNVIEACLQLSDVRRAGEWSDAAGAWCETVPSESAFQGMCRVYRAEVARLRGSWPEAEAEAIRAVDELRRLDDEAAAPAYYEIGEIRRRSGNLAGAEEAFARAHELGVDPQPGLALLRLAQGKVDAGRTGLRLSASGPSSSPLLRTRLLAALVEIELAAGDVDAARTARDELLAIADTVETASLEATALTADGAVRLADGDVAGAIDRLRRAGAAWQELRLPYETATARASFARALRAAGDEDDAALELRAALAAFERLGAVPDATSAAALLGADERPRGLTGRETEVLRLVASGKTNRDIAVELVISEHTVARHLQNIFAKLDVSSRSAATAFAYEHGLA